jgi:hypothetical protein
MSPRRPPKVEKPCNSEIVWSEDVARGVPDAQNEDGIAVDLKKHPVFSSLAAEKKLAKFQTDVWCLGRQRTAFWAFPERRNACYELHQPAPAGPLSRSFVEPTHDLADVLLGLVSENHIILHATVLPG